MNKCLPILLLAICLAANDSLARGGFSSGGRGGFSSGRSYSSPSRTTVTRTTTINRFYGGGYRGYYGGAYGYHPMMYGGFGMGYGYSNGLVEGLIIGNLMHPAGTTVYGGGGYSGQALLYPDGRVVDQNGMQVGMYQDNRFTPVQGGMVAQQAPANAVQQMQQPQPVLIRQAGPDAADIICGILVVIVVIAILVAIIL